MESAFVLLRDIGEGCTCECKCAVSLVRGTIGGDSSGWVPNKRESTNIVLGAFYIILPVEIKGCNLKNKRNLHSQLSDMRFFNL